MARGIRLTKTERESLRVLIGPVNVNLGSHGSKLVRDAAAILRKLSDSEETPKGVDIVPIEEALIAAARGKVIPLEGGHAQASVRAAQMKATPEDAALVGAYLARTAYFTQPMTVLDVLNKWWSWLPKARASAPPPSLAPGLGSNGLAREPTEASGNAGVQKPAGRMAKSVPGFR